MITTIPVDETKKMLRTMQAWIEANAEYRIAGASFGEVGVRMQWNDGELIAIRINEETVIKSEREIPDENKKRKLRVKSS